MRRGAWLLVPILALMLAGCATHPDGNERFVSLSSFCERTMHPAERSKGGGTVGNNPYAVAAVVGAIVLIGETCHLTR